MERLKIEPRQNWTKEVEALGFDFYKEDGVPYWGEDACYRFTADDQGSLPTSSSVRVFDAAASCRRIVAPLVEAIGLF